MFTNYLRKKPLKYVVGLRYIDCTLPFFIQTHVGKKKRFRIFETSILVTTEEVNNLWVMYIQSGQFQFLPVLKRSHERDFSRVNRKGSAHRRDEACRNAFERVHLNAPPVRLLN